jgi:hypothetical protein
MPEKLIGAAIQDISQIQMGIHGKWPAIPFFNSIKEIWFYLIKSPTMASTGWLSADGERHIRLPEHNELAKVKED